MSKFRGDPMVYVGSIFVMVTLASSRLSRTSPRIINGTEINPPHKYPFMAAFYWDGCDPDGQCYPGAKQFPCGGSILNKHWILTAAHCCADVEMDAIPGVPTYQHWFMITGAHNLSALSPWSQNLSISHCVIHPYWNLSSITNDIALVRVKGAINLNDKVAPINLPSVAFDVTVDGEIKAQAIGWGYIGYINGKRNETEVPMEVTLPLVTLDTCQRAFGYFETNYTGNRRFNASFPVIETELCAGYGASPNSICYGDSGSALLTYNPDLGTYTQVGLTSWGVSCGREGLYNVFTNVAKYVAWINSVLLACPKRIIEKPEA